MMSGKGAFPQQLALRFRLREDATFDNFVSEDQPSPVERLRHFLAQPEENFLYLYGSLGSGTTHLLHAACHTQDSEGKHTIYMPLDQLADATAEALEGLEHFDLVCLDEVDCIAGEETSEAALFHCFNRIRDSGGKLIIAGHQPVRGLGLKLPDLISRLQWGAPLHLSPRSDAVKVQILQQRANSLGMRLSEDVMAYIMKRSGRSLDELLEVLEHLDRESLSAQRKLTVPFVKQIMGW